NRAVVFGYSTKDPQRYGDVSFDKAGKAVSIVEKPAIPQANYAVVGLYFYPNNVIQHTKTLTPSDRGELEITDLNNIYLKQSQISVTSLGRGSAWFDTGSHESLVAVTEFPTTVEQRTGIKIGCFAEIALFQN